MNLDRHRRWSRVRGLIAGAAAVGITALGAASVTTPAAAAAATGSTATTTAARAPAASSGAAGNPYGNPYNNYLRQPFGVLPQGDSGTPPVQDNSNEPFDWYRSPWAALGVFGGVQDTMITPQGFLQNDFGTLQFDTGSSLTPINQRVKTWMDGWLPVAEYTYPSGGADYHVEAFDTTVPGVTTIPVSQTYGVGSRRTTVTANVPNIVTYARVTVTNTTATAGTFTLGIGLTSQPITNPVHRGARLPVNLAYDPASQALTGTGAAGTSEAALAVDTPPTTNVGGADHTLAYQMTLAPNASQSVTVILPYWIAQASDLGPIEKADYTAERTATQQFWTSELADAGDVSVPEAKVTDAYKASVVALLLDALKIIGNHWYTIANPTVYDGPYLRDGAFHIEALLDAGFTGVVRHILEDYSAWQDPTTGRYVGAQAGEYDSNGEALWAIGQYLQFTRDTAFAKTILPSVQASMNWELNYRQGGLYPVNEIGDDEQVQGHITGFDLWAISGEEAAVTVAAQAGDTSDATSWAQQATQFAQILKQQLEPAFQQLGVVPPSTEGINGKGLEDAWYGNVYGIDWGNLGLVWPSGVFAPNDPMVTSSLKVWQQKEFDGIFGYPAGGDESLLHSYAPLSIPETYTRAGDQWQAISYLYDTLVHTSAMDMASEGMDGSGRWGWSQGDETQPHNQFSAEYISVAHDMLAYAGQDGSLYLASTYSPAWTKPGQQITFSGPTAYGPASYAITMGSNGMTMKLNPPTRNAPHSIIVHTPQNTTVTSLTGASGVTASGNQITLPPLTQPVTLQVQWKVTGAAPVYSYNRAVRDYLKDYHQMTSPPDVHIGSIQANHTVGAGLPLQVNTTVVNTGGASRLSDPRVVWYVDGKPAYTDDKTLANGIGYNTPAGIISFGGHTEGDVPVGFTTTLCTTGTHTIGVGLGSNPPAQTVTVSVTPLVPTQPAPPASMTLHTSTLFTGSNSGAGTATATVTDQGCADMANVAATLQAPTGWTVTPTSQTTVNTIAPGQSATVTWQIQPPTGSPGGSHITATASYGWKTDQFQGQTTGSATAETTPVICSGSPPQADANARAQWDFTLGCAADLSDHGEDGTAGPGVTFTSAGANFNGTGTGAITVPYDSSYQPDSITSGQTWTLNLTGVVPGAIGPNYQALANARSNSGGFDSGWTVYITPGGTFQFWMSQTGDTYAAASSGVQAQAGKTYDITAKWDGSALSITVSGAGSGSGSAPGASYLPDNGQPATLGQGSSEGSGTYFYTGTIASAEISVT